MQGMAVAKASNANPMRIGVAIRLPTHEPDPSYSIQLRGCITVMANI